MKLLPGYIPSNLVDAAESEAGIGGAAVAAAIPLTLSAPAVLTSSIHIVDFIFFVVFVAVVVAVIVVVVVAVAAAASAAAAALASLAFASLAAAAAIAASSLLGSSAPVRWYRIKPLRVVAPVFFNAVAANVDKDTAVEPSRRQEEDAARTSMVRRSSEAMERM